MSTRMPQLVCATALLLSVLVVSQAASAARSGPGTSARPIQTRIGATTCHQYCGTTGRVTHAKTTPVIVRTEVVAPQAGFRWLDAAIGFGVASGLALLAAGALVAKRRVRVAPLEPAG
jgi:hypothetical protein